MAVRIQDGSGNSLTSTAAALDVNVKSTGATQPISAASLPLPLNAAQETGGNLAAVAGQLPAATAKGTQASTFGAVQQPKDTGRTKVILTLTKATAIVAEALVTTLVVKKGDAAAVVGQTAYTITAGKTLRLQSMFVSITNVTAAAIDAVAVRLREGAAAGGALALASDIIAELEASNPAATLNTSGQAWTSWPDGMEITGNQQIGISMVSPNVDGQVTVVITAYEY